MIDYLFEQDISLWKLWWIFFGSG